jgi:hypothetical protein
LKFFQSILVLLLQDLGIVNEKFGWTRTDRRRFAALATGAALNVIDDQLVIIDVDKDSPAARAGLKRGDVVLAIDSHRFDAKFLAAARHLPLTGEDITSPEAQPASADEAMRFAQLRAVRRALQGVPLRY